MVDIAKEFFDDSILTKYLRVLSFLRKIEIQIDKEVENQKNIKKELKDLAGLPPTKENIARRRELAKLVKDNIDIHCNNKEESFLANNYKKFKPLIKKDKEVKDGMVKIIPNTLGLRKLIREILG